MASLGIRRVFSDLFSIRRDELAKVASMAALFFLVVGTIGIMKPIKNALALGGLGASGFFKVYLVSAAVVVFVPPYNRLANRVPWRWLIPSVAVFFALNLPLVLLAPILGVPVELDIILLGQHHDLLGKGRGDIVARWSLLGVGGGLEIGEFHELRYNPTTSPESISLTYYFA